MKKNYIQPATTVVRVAVHGHILDGSPVRSVSSGNVGLNYGGGSNQASRVKEQDNYNVWDDDWSQ